jgi:hypothetical protein
MVPHRVGPLGFPLGRVVRILSSYRTTVMKLTSHNTEMIRFCQLHDISVDQSYPERRVDGPQWQATSKIKTHQASSLQLWVEPVANPGRKTVKLKAIHINWVPSSP